MVAPAGGPDVSLLQQQVTDDGYRRTRAHRLVMVAALETQAGSPPSGPVLLGRLARIEGLGELDLRE